MVKTLLFTAPMVFICIGLFCAWLSCVYEVYRLFTGQLDEWQKQEMAPIVILVLAGPLVAAFIILDSLGVID